MEISQLLASKGASQKDSPVTQNSKGGSGDSAKFAQLYQKAGQSAKPTAQSSAQPSVEPGAAKGSSPALAAGNAGLKGLSGAKNDAPLDKLLDKLDAGIELSDEEASMLDGLADATQMPTELTPLAQQIATLVGSNVQTPADTLQGSGQVSQSATEGSLTSQDSPLGLGSIRQRLELIAQAQRGDATAQPAQLAQLNQAQQPAALIAAQGDQTLSPLDKLGDKAAATRLTDSGALRHQTLTAQGQSGAFAQAGTLTQENTTTNAQQSGAFGATNTFIEAVAANAGSDGLNGRGGSEALAGQGMTGAGATGAASQTAGQTQGITQPTLSAPLASAQWQQGLGQQLVSMHRRGDQRVELHLHPADLGPISISLKMDDQLAQAQFSSANPHVRAAIEQAIPQLREALAENGIQLGEAMVGQQNQQREDGQPGERGGSMLANSPSGLGTVDGSESLIMTPQSIDIDGRVNLYA